MGLGLGLRVGMGTGMGMEMPLEGSSSLEPINFFYFTVVLSRTQATDDPPPKRLQLLIELIHFPRFRKQFAHASLIG